MSTPTDFPDIPDFLRRSKDEQPPTAEERAAHREWLAKTLPQRAAFGKTAKPTDPSTIEFVAEQERIAKAAAREKKRRGKENREAARRRARGLTAPRKPG